MKILPFQAVYPNLDFITSTDTFIKNVKQDYVEFKKAGFFHKEKDDAIFVYRIKTSEGAYTGLVGCATVEDYRKNNIKKHENTLASKEQQQINLMLKRGAAVKPVLLTYRNTKTIDSIVKRITKDNKVFYKVKSGIEAPITHTFWKVDNADDIKAIQKAFEKEVDCTYIADGHHRSSSGSIMYDRMEDKAIKGDFDKILAAFFPVSQLSIYDYNRVVEGIRFRSTAQLIVELSQVFDLEILKKPAKPKKKHEITMLLRGEWFKLTWKKEFLAKQEKSKKPVLDASLLDEEVMRKIMLIEDTTTDSRITYVEGPKGIDGLVKKVQKDDNQVAFCLYPVEAEDFIAISDAGEIMPPKSTWFEPRIKNGLLVFEY